MADVQQQEEEIRQAAEMHRERQIAFYASSLDAFYTTSLEYDKGLFALCAGGLGLLVTLLTTVGIVSVAELVVYFVGIVAFTFALAVVLWIFRYNKTHIIAVVGNDDSASSKKLRIADRTALVAFGIGVLCSAAVGFLAAINSYDTKVKAMADNKPSTQLNIANESFDGLRNLRPDVMQKSFIDADKLRPVASTGASSPATQQPVAQQSSGSAPAAPASNPTQTGK